MGSLLRSRFGSASRDLAEPARDCKVFIARGWPAFMTSEAAPRWTPTRQIWSGFARGFSWCHRLLAFRRTSARPELLVVGAQEEVLSQYGRCVWAQIVQLSMHFDKARLCSWSENVGVSHARGKALTDIFEAGLCPRFVYIQ